jgi:hypothetical protein
MIVGTAAGLEEVTREGSVGRRLAAGPALHPRFRGPHELVVLATTDEDLSSTKPVDVRLVSLDTGAARSVGTFPVFRCRETADAGTADAGPDAAAPAEEDWAWDVSLQTEVDFSVTPDGRSVCLTRLDRNLNMADLWLSQRMDVATGAVTSVLVIGSDHCPAPPGVKVGGQDLCPGRRGGRKPAVGSFPYRFDGGKVVRRDPAGDQTVARLKQFTTAEDRSPSGRWLLVSRHVDEDESDYIYRQVALLDLGSGRLYPLPAREAHAAVPWPAPFDLARFKPAAAAKQTVTVVGESDMTWLPFTGDDLLVLEKNLVAPEHASVALPGDVAR